MKVINGHKKIQAAVDDLKLYFLQDLGIVQRRYNFSHTETMGMTASFLVTFSHYLIYNLKDQELKNTLITFKAHMLKVINEDL